MFADETKAQQLIDRICGRLNRSIGDDLWRLFEGWPNADEWIARLDRIVGAMSGAGGLADHLVEMPELASIFVGVICTSGHLADLLVQNPELVSLLFDPHVLGKVRNRDHVIAEGNRLLAHATGYTHQLDRLRFMKQEGVLILAAQDIGGLMLQPQIWRGVSELAVGLMELAKRVAWAQFRKRGDYPEECPVGVLVFGKLGGLELNYSSDIDLVFVKGDGIDEDGARKFCELFRSAVADRMGRGDLYRVDLRLRPFGSQGPIVSTCSSVEKYYASYAEPWEQMALIRSYMLSSDPAMVDWWEGLRSKVAFAGARSEMALGNLLKMRRRAEEEADEGDIKRGVGGIRDVELCTQVVQLLNGEARPELQGRSTLEMLDLEIEAGLIDAGMGRMFAENYEFFRKVEHRVQIMANRQVYSLPENIDSRAVVSKSLGYWTVGALEDELLSRRSEVRRGFETMFGPLLGKVDDGIGAELSWLNEEYRPALQENVSSRARFLQVTEQAPAVIHYLQQSPSVLEQVMSGEIQEWVDSRERFKPLRRHYDRGEMQRALRNGWLRTILRCVLADVNGMGVRLAEHFQAAIEVLAMHWGNSTSVVGLGSFAAGEMSPGSDADLLVLVGDDEERMMVERSVQSALIELGKLKALGVPFSVDFRLRPEGRNGRLAVTPEGLRKYAATFMEPWERFALGRANVVFGDQAMGKVVQEVAYGDDFGREDLEQLLHMKERIERERVKPGQRDRHIKLGRGGLDDIVWLLQLWMLVKSGSVAGLDVVPLNTVDRVRILVAIGVLDVVEQEAILEAHEYLTAMRNSLYLLGVGDDVFPENPDRLAALGRRFGLDDPNAVLALHQKQAGRVRSIFEEGITRMKAQ